MRHSHRHLASALDRVSDRATLVAEQLKSARATLLSEIGLQLRDALVQQSHQPTAKLAMAADVIDQLSSLVGELQSAHRTSVKVAAALAGAVKLAQDGAIDIEDVFDAAREALLTGNVKTSTINEVFDQSPGETRPSTTPQGGLDPLTATLRALRR